MKILPLLDGFTKESNEMNGLAATPKLALEDKKVLLQST